jgi:hypothetical protein
LSDPTQLVYYYYYNHPRQGYWLPNDAVQISNNEFEDWEGIHTDFTDDMFWRLYVYSSSKVVEVVVDVIFSHLSFVGTYDLNALSNGFLFQPMTQITAWGKVKGTMYIARAGAKISDPGEVRFA